ncbi:hypothetical protein L596_030091 [Steinernema carpocapsae]|uniref:Uncharacterized protein n=1 Tax=Steinernema carpocapsae TaxID=34508 RepID=A0A4U5LRQ5_STECR|nr:hypothetical protein L596_030091 [Steinernema carpocapsae]
MATSTVVLNIDPASQRIIEEILDASSKIKSLNSEAKIFAERSYKTFKNKYGVGKTSYTEKTTLTMLIDYFLLSKKAKEDFK